MAIINCNYKSSVLGKATEFAAIVPDKKIDGKMKVLYLLHGLSDDYTAWTRYTSIERYVRNNQDTIIVMPDAGRSFYSDMCYGGAYYTYITKELPEFIQSVFNASDKREDTFIAGLSMGGYGAFKIALRNPDKYAAVASFSGVLDVKEHLENDRTNESECKAILGDEKIVTPNDDIMELIKRNSVNKPRLLQMCGTSDFLYRDNVKFREEISKLNFEHEYIEDEGEHTWDFWDECIKYALKFFGIVK